MQLNPLNTACFTGHRPNAFGTQKSPDQIEKEISYFLKMAITYLYNMGYRNFISGGALGVDQWAASEVADLRDYYDQRINLIIARPFPSQDAKWSERDKQNLLDLCNRADSVIDVSPDPYAPWKMHARNAYMVNNSSAVVAVKIPEVTTGGTASCCTYAERKGKSMIYIDPVALKIDYSSLE